MIENLSTANTRPSAAVTLSSQADEPGAMMEAEEKDELSPVEDDSIKKLYPFVDETKTPLPRFWNNGDKYNYLIVTNQNLRVTYRGAGKNHKDAAAVRANFPIPATCGIYYFEITIVSKGRDGYMGIGLSEKEVSLNRLPGWDRNSYGYHADDGNFFSSSGNGTQYGPTFTTNDVVGCGFNLIDNTIFYTKNGQNLGVAFHDVPCSEELYPTVGLQTPGEIIDTNFGQKPFVFDIQDEIKEAQMRVQASIFNFQLPATKTEWMNKLVSSYLVHHGFCATAESFNLATSQRTIEDAASMTNRQQIQKLVLNGHIAEAIEMVEQIYPMLLHTNKPLMFMLKCRQFIEMLAQVTQERDAPSSSHHRSSPTCSPPYKLSKRRPSPNDREHRLSPRRTTRSPRSHEDTPSSSGHISNGANHDEPMEDGVYTNGSASNGANNNAAVKNGSQPDEDMDDIDESSNGFAPPPAPASFEKFRDVLAFGQEINALSKEITTNSRSVQLQRKRMNDAFSLVCYAKPKESPNGYLLEPSQRAPVAAALNSAILEDQGQCARPPLEVLLAHARRLREETANAKIGAATFADPDRICRGGSLQ